MKLIIIDPSNHEVREVEVEPNWVSNLQTVTGSDCFHGICSAGHINIGGKFNPVYVEDSGLYKYSDLFMHRGYSEPLAGPGIVAPYDEGDLSPMGFITAEEAGKMPTLEEVKEAVTFVTSRPH
jgi:hypothetical protein